MEVFCSERLKKKIHSGILTEKSFEGLGLPQINGEEKQAPASLVLAK